MERSRAFGISPDLQSVRTTYPNLQMGLGLTHTLTSLAGSLFICLCAGQFGTDVVVIQL